VGCLKLKIIYNLQQIIYVLYINRLTY